MKPASRRHIEIQVRMMHAMHPPQRRYCMKDHMLNVDSEIKAMKLVASRSVRGCEIVKQSPAMFFGLKSKADNADW